MHSALNWIVLYHIPRISVSSEVISLGQTHAHLFVILILATE